MDNAEFKKQAHLMVDWMADYLENIENRPVRAPVKPGEITAQIPISPPQHGESMARIMNDFCQIVVPGITHWQHPSFFAYFPANASPPSILAEMLVATMGPVCMLWQTSPAATELETQVLEWLRELFGLPLGLVGVIQDTASTATLCSLLAARESATAHRTNQYGLKTVSPLTLYCSAEAHSSVAKAVKILGLGSDNLRSIPVDSQFAMQPDLLKDAIQRDIAAGCRPFCVVATLGTTSTSGFDPLVPIGDLCRQHDLWLHVDAAWAGSALAAPEFRWMINGISKADSIVINPHKWLLTNFDCTAHFVRHPEELVKALSIQPEYLKTTNQQLVTDYRDWGIPLGRRFRALKLWFVLRYYGIEGIQKHIRVHVKLAQELGDLIEAEEDFQLLVPPTLTLLCFRYRPTGNVSEQTLNSINQQLIESLNDSGEVYLTHTRIQDQFCLRFAIGAQRTERQHVRQAWATIKETARSLPL